MPWWKKLGLTTLTLAVLLVGLNALFIWFPRSDSPAHADVVVAIGGANDKARLARAVQLVKDGYAPLLLTDIVSMRKCHTAVPTTCFHPNPFTTQGEARELAAQARAHGWNSALLVLSRDQATRARIRFRRCYDGGLRIITVSTGSQYFYRTAYEDAAMVKAETLQRGC